MKILVQKFHVHKTQKNRKNTKSQNLPVLKGLGWFKALKIRGLISSFCVLRRDLLVATLLPAVVRVVVVRDRLSEERVPPRLRIEAVLPGHLNAGVLRLNRDYYSGNSTELEPPNRTYLIFKRRAVMGFFLKPLQQRGNFVTSLQRLVRVPGLNVTTIWPL